MNDLAAAARVRKHAVSAMNLGKLHAAARSAEHAFHDAIVERIRRGQTVRVEHSRGVVWAEVTDVSSERIKVRADESGKEYWVGVWRIVGWDAL